MFSPNAKNSGGFQSINRQLEKHQEALRQSKPSLNTHIRPRPHIDANRTNKVQRIIERNFSAEVFETFRRANAVQHGMIDSAKPNSFDMMSQLLTTKQRNKTKHFNQHQSTWGRHQRELQRIRDRPTTYTPYEYKGIYKTKASRSNERLSTSASQQKWLFYLHPTVADELSFAMLPKEEEKEMISTTQIEQERTTIKSIGSSSPKQRKRLLTDESAEISYLPPRVTSFGKNTQVELQRQLFDIVIRHQLWDEASVNRLFERTRRVNPASLWNTLDSIRDKILTELIGLRL
eukprot:TRINITY_DN22303_c0_g1_i1.p1 TRINITY_DN22303_c0_g1~~TRINITY_DN22303_c0_g1_i1.p1  ORF type:complete len:290 (-),score=31.40 TRINITY_DN22303_c0_g1_i1:93-962(-)